MYVYKLVHFTFSSIGVSETEKFWQQSLDLFNGDFHEAWHASVTSCGSFAILKTYCRFWLEPPLKRIQRPATITLTNDEVIEGSLGYPFTWDPMSPYINNCINNSILFVINNKLDMQFNKDYFYSLKCNTEMKYIHPKYDFG